MIQVGEELKYLSRKLPGIEQMSLHYAALGSYEELKRDLLTAAADLALFGDEDDEAANRIRTRDAFAARAQEGWKRLTQSANEVSAAATEALVLRHQLHQRLAEDFPPLLLPAGRDLRDQLARLVPPRFLVRTPTVWLKHLPRFLKGMQIRVQRLFNAGLARDAAASAELAPLWKQYLQRELNHRPGTQRPGARTVPLDAGGTARIPFRAGAEDVGSRVGKAAGSAVGAGGAVGRPRVNARRSAATAPRPMTGCDSLMQSIAHHVRCPRRAKPCGA
jgi:ATP-dependent helicase HrpA